MKTLILYKSRGGTTKRYAEWLIEDFPDSDLFTVDQFDISMFPTYDRIVFCSPTYSGKIVGKEYLVEHWDKMMQSEVFLLVVGMIPQDTDWSRKSYDAIPTNIRESFYGYLKVPGKNPEPNKETGRIERFFMKVFMKLEPEDIEKQPEVRKENVEPVVDWLNK